MALQLFGRTKKLERQVDEFLDIVADSGLTFEQAISAYLSEGHESQRFTAKIDQIVQLETRADHIGNAVELEMYSETLIPDARGDVLKLLESLDAIVNAFKGILFYFLTETPAIPEDLKGSYKDLSELTTRSVSDLVIAVRVFFRDPKGIKDHLHKVRYHEKEADQVVTELRQAIFKRDIHLAEKIHLRFFAERIVWVSDMAEDVADNLAIYAVKRNI
ncbi:MAG: DUF47 family protein [Pseudomonadota bacterium]